MLDHTWTHNSNSGFAPFGYPEPNVADTHNDRVKKGRLLILVSKYKEQSERITTYWTLAFGALYYTREITATGHKIDRPHQSGLLPAGRLAFGTHIYFTPMIGMQLEIGAGGGAPFEMGLVFRL